MPGTIIVKPIEANLTHNTSKVSGMDPYCVAVSKGKKVKSSICYNGGKAPFWEDDALVLKVNDESTCVVEIKDKTILLPDPNIGSVELDVQEVETHGSISKWYPITFNDKCAGQILMEASFNPDDSVEPVERKEEDLVEQTQAATEEEEEEQEPTPVDEAFERPHLSDVILVATLDVPSSREEMKSLRVEIQEESYEQNNQDVKEVSLTPQDQPIENMDTTMKSIEYQPQEEKELQYVADENLTEEAQCEDAQELNDETLSNLSNRA